jgi:N-methylhydantoinase A
MRRDDLSAIGVAQGNERRRLAIDVGGTFIDYVLFDERTGAVSVDKEPAYRDEVQDQLFVGYDRVVDGAPPLARIIHGSTLAINTILQESGAKVGLITTNGFRDVLELGRGNRTDIYDFFLNPPKVLVPRFLRREVTERVGASGEELIALNLDDLRREAEFLVHSGVDAVAVCFLHSYANPEHEKQARAWLVDEYPSLIVSTSHEVATEWREYERTSTVVLNAYLMPSLTKYFSDIEKGLGERGFSGDLAIMQSNGGVMPAGVASQIPIRTLESGPAGGVVGARVLAGAMGESNVICTDVGGTTFDVALISGGDVIERYKTQVAKRPILAPITDITSIGAGGGSIAWIDEQNSMRVGPMSAGARPGPACFGFGGDKPTVTDCNLLLGRLDRDNFLGRRMRLSVDAAAAAVATVAEPLEMDLATAAGGIIRLAETNMAYAVRQVTIERGHDPRLFSLLAYGGGGGFFASALMKDLETSRAVIPEAAAVFSAWGLLFADYREDASVTRVFPITDDNHDEFVDLARGVVSEVLPKLARHGFDITKAITTVRTEIRFVGQEHTLTVPISLDGDAASVVRRLREDFSGRHLAQYGQADISRGIEVVTVRATALGQVSHPSLIKPLSNREPVVPRSVRRVWFSGANEFVESTIWAREDLVPGAQVDGPAVIEEWNSTILVAPHQMATVDEFGSVILTNSANMLHTGI